MTRAPRASIIINNYNYGRYLREAIHSALGQTYPDVEVIVVDDGSTDDSREVIASYSQRIIPILKDNGGQTSALNVGLGASQGEVICFLDADDILVRTAIERTVALFAKDDTAKVHWPLWEIDECGHKKGPVRPHQPLPEGELRELILREGPMSYVIPPTSGNAWNRAFLEQVFPIPEGVGNAGADTYLSSLAPLYGRVSVLPEPLGYYRVHGRNEYARLPFAERLSRDLSIYDYCCQGLIASCRRLGIDGRPDQWKSNSWFHRLAQSVEDILATVPPGETFILVDEDQWGTSEAYYGRRRLPFLERGGEYNGPPADDEAAIRELNKLRRAGAGFIIFAWPAFWWLEYYSKFHCYLRSHFPCVRNNSRVVIFKLANASTLNSRAAVPDTAPTRIADQ